MKALERFAGLIRARTLDGWRNQVFGIAASLGYEQTLLAILPNRNAPMEARHAFLHSNYSTAWLTRYDEKKLGYIDPAVSHCLSRTVPLVWSPKIFSTRKQKALYEEACSHGLRAGISLPMHGVGGELGILCFASAREPLGQFQRDARIQLPELSCFRDFVFETSLRFMPSSPPAQDSAPLTLRELECLKWSMTGKSSWEIARILRCSEATVNYHFSNIRRKFNVNTRQQATVKAIQMGLIQPA